MKTDALVGTVVPAPALFNARAENGDNYRSLANVASLGGPVGQGGSSTGKVYFDVVGSTPNTSGGEIGGGEGGTEGAGGNLDSGGGSGAPSGDTG